MTTKEEEFLKILYNNEYYKRTKERIESRNKYESIIYLVENKSITQRTLKKLKIFISKYIIDIILNNTELRYEENEDTKTGQVFIDDKNKKVYYSEIVNNIHKAGRSMDKIEKNKRKIEEKYKDYELITSLVSIRFLSKTEIKDIELNKSNRVKDKIEGINDYINKLGKKDNNLTYDIYKIVINKFAIVV